LFGINFEATSKNRETGGGVGLRWPLFYEYIQETQMEVGVWGGEYIEEEARPGRNVWGGRGPYIFAVKQSVKNKEK
jgi:hypothetical protein